MFRKFIRDESGMAMGLVVVMVVLIGVMGAGLLVFVQKDLESVIEVNQGQKALDIADAGVQAAKQQVLGDKEPGHYDVESTANPNYIHTSCNTDLKDPDDSTEPEKDVQREPAAENWSPEAGGQTRSFVGGQFTVTIRWLTTNPTIGTPAECIAPETGALPEGTDYFKIISTGRYGNATRRIETIQRTHPLNIPKAYYTPGPVTISGTACIDSVSLFTKSSVTFNGSGGCPGGGHLRNTDLAYGDWNNPPSDKFNTTPRLTSDAGVGAMGQITGSPDLGTRDFDGPDAEADGPEFVQAPSDPQTADEITFPFDLADQPDANRLCDIARDKGSGYYEEYTTTGNKFLNSWPADSSSSTVVCKVFKNFASSNKLIWNVDGNTALASPYDGCEGPVQQGTLVIRGGNFSTKSNTALFRGVVVVRGMEGVDASDLGNSSDTGNTCLDGFVNATSEIKIAGTVRPSTSVQANNRPGFYGVKTWSWRELYE